jgi:hypothetical protein
MTKSSIRVAVQRLDPTLALPVTAHAGDAGVDLYAREDATIAAGGGRILMPTGLAVAIPLGYAGFVRWRLWALWQVTSESLAHGSRECSLARRLQSFHRQAQRCWKTLRDYLRRDIERRHGCLCRSRKNARGC